MTSEIGQFKDVRVKILWSTSSKQNPSLESFCHKISENIYTLLGLALMVCTQFQLERKHEF